MNDLNYFLTGAAGFVGEHLAGQLRNAGHGVKQTMQYELKKLKTTKK